MTEFILDSNNRNVIGTDGDDNFISSNTDGNFTLDGGAGFDTLKLRTFGLFGRFIPPTESGGAGTYSQSGFTVTARNVENFIAPGDGRPQGFDFPSKGPSYRISGSTSSGMGNFNVDLSTNQLIVENTPTGNLTLRVEGFDSVFGTSNDDIIKGSDRVDGISGEGGNDTFIATKGSDVYTGGDGFDTLDYRPLNTGVNLNFRGATFGPVVVSITKEDKSTDVVGGVEKFIGVAGKTNTIDGSVFTYFNDTSPRIRSDASLNVDLSKNNLTFNNKDLPGGKQSFEVENFNDVNGTNNNDTIVGNDCDNKLTGGKGNDILTGGNGNDLLNGTSITARGVGEIDTLTGGGGADTFVLGDDKGSFYLGNGKDDYALINDFDLTQDRIQLGANQNLLSVKFDRKSGTIDLFSAQNGGQDLVAKVKLTNPFNFSSRSEMGMGNYKTAMTANGVMDGETILSPAGIGGDTFSIEAMFAKSIVA